MSETCLNVKESEGEPNRDKWAGDPRAKWMSRGAGSNWWARSGRSSRNRLAKISRWNRLVRLDRLNTGCTAMWGRPGWTSKWSRWNDHHRSTVLARQAKQVEPVKQVNGLDQVGRWSRLVSPGQPQTGQTRGGRRRPGAISWWVGVMTPWRLGMGQWQGVSSSKAQDHELL